MAESAAETHFGLLTKVEAPVTDQSSKHLHLCASDLFTCLKGACGIPSGSSSGCWKINWTWTTTTGRMESLGYGDRNSFPKSLYHSWREQKAGNSLDLTFTVKELFGEFKPSEPRNIRQDLSDSILASMLGQNRFRSAGWLLQNPFRSI